MRCFAEFIVVQRLLQVKCRVSTTTVFETLRGNCSAVVMGWYRANVACCGPAHEKFGGRMMANYCNVG